MATWFSASAVVPALRAEWHLTAGGAVWPRPRSARLRHRRRGGRAQPRRPRPGAPARRRVRARRGRGDGLRRRVRRRPRGGVRCGSSPASPSPGSPYRPEAHDVVVRPRTRLRPRRAGRRPDAGQRAPQLISAFAALPVARCCWWPRRARRRAGCSRRGLSRPGPLAAPAPPFRPRYALTLSANGARGWPTSATSGTCGSCTRCGRGCPPPRREHRDSRCAAARRCARLPRDEVAKSCGTWSAAGWATGSTGWRRWRWRSAAPAACWPRSPSAARRPCCWRWCSSGCCR